MGETIGIFSAITGLVVALAMVCTLIYAGMRSQSALLWLSGALAAAALEIVVLQPSVEPVLQTTSVSILLPLAYFCGSQAIRLAAGRKQSSGSFVAIIALLICISLVVVGSGVENVYQTLPYKLAAAMAIGDILWCLVRIRNKSLIDYGLLVAVTGLATIFALRLPIYPTMASDAPSLYGLNRPEIERLLLAMVALVSPAIVLLLVAKVLTAAMASYREKSERDELTDLLNRRAFERMATEMKDRSGVVILCDIDHFKRINDRYGHRVGDDVIRAFGQRLREICAKAARIGGEEFAILVPDGSLAEAVAMTSVLRARLEDVRHLEIDPEHRLTASFGVAAFSPDQPFHDAVEAADKALYLAKNAGRDRVATHPEGLLAPREAWRAA
ncbi:GGDEF domain-containing protein [Aurantimonas sp. 22II-16-19i]|uniref:GGDEF domain-containing protein n=1 Tax=Aurantimonas sp. 22II-16-19i TaxID=1317114 RepID=UPI0009F7FB64|nr:GGDEF domain-containing protein [Aurantimonas sp. 22II-16-19i]ORE98828.1 hypothetical protein ATO4_00640 [Aurantimonas sp. 22II-16-19i]